MSLAATRQENVSQKAYSDDMTGRSIAFEGESRLQRQALIPLS